MKMTMRLRDLLVMFIAAFVFLPSGANAKSTDAPTASPTAKPTAKPTPMPTPMPTPIPTPMPITTTTSELTTTTTCESYENKTYYNDPCWGYSSDCCTSYAVTGGCCTWKDTTKCNSDNWGTACCESSTNSTVMEECTSTGVDSDVAEAVALFVVAPSSGSKSTTAISSTSMTAALVVLALVVMGYAAFVLVKRHQQKKGTSYTWPEENETTPIMA